MDTAMASPRRAGRPWPAGRTGPAAGTARRPGRRRRGGAGGADGLGVVHVAEAMRLRRAGITLPLLCLMALGDDAHEDAIRAEVDLSAGSGPMVRRIARAAAAAGTPARLHLKADTGLSRGGATAAEWPEVVEAAL